MKQRSDQENKDNCYDFLLESLGDLE